MVTLTVVDGLVLARHSDQPNSLHPVLDHLASTEVQVRLATASGNSAPHRIAECRWINDPFRQEIRRSIGDS